MAFKPSTPNESKKKMPVFDSTFSMLHQYLPPLLKLSVFAIRNGYFPFFFRNDRFMSNEFVHVV